MNGISAGVCSLLAHSRAEGLDAVSLSSMAQKHRPCSGRLSPCSGVCFIPEPSTGRAEPTPDSIHAWLRHSHLPAPGEGKKPGPWPVLSLTH